MGYPFRNLVFEGGGVKGLAYVGALQCFQQKGILPSITRVGGASAGAICALLVGLNLPVDKISSIFLNLDFKKFLDSSWGVVRETDRLINEFGWYKGDFFRSWAADVIAAQTGNSESTFNDVANLKTQKGFRDLYFIGTNLSTRYAEVFSAEHTPRMCIADAVRISMSIPLFFAAKKSMRGDVYVDGGVLDNYPVKLFDRQKYVKSSFFIPDDYKAHNTLLNQTGVAVSPYVYNQETLGFRLDSAAEIAVFRDQAEPQHETVNDFFDYVKALMGTLMACQEGQHLGSNDWQRTIYIDTLGVGTTEFDITDAKKNDLIASGKKGAETYFAWYDNPANKPVNRP